MARGDPLRLDVESFASSNAAIAIAQQADQSMNRSVRGGLPLAFDAATQLGQEIEGKILAAAHDRA